jgi:hypothetical protein
LLFALWSVPFRQEVEIIIVKVKTKGLSIK